MVHRVNHGRFDTQIAVLSTRSNVPLRAHVARLENRIRELEAIIDKLTRGGKRQASRVDMQSTPYATKDSLSMTCFIERTTRRFVLLTSIFLTLIIILASAKYAISFSWRALIVSGLIGVVGAFAAWSYCAFSIRQMRFDVKWHGIALCAILLLTTTVLARSTIPMRLYFGLFQQHFERTAHEALRIPQKNPVRIGIFNYDVRTDSLYPYSDAIVRIHPTGEESERAMFEYRPSTSALLPWSLTGHRMRLSEEWWFTANPIFTPRFVAWPVSKPPS